MLRDVRLAIRRFWFKPAHTLLMVLIIGVGIGAATAVFSVVDQTILRPPPFAHADRLVEVWERYRSGGLSSSLPTEKIVSWQKQRALFETFEGYAFRQVDLTGEGIEPERVSGLVVTNGLFPMLGVQPSLGRGFADTDGRPGSERVVIISDGLWKRNGQFASPAASGGNPPRTRGYEGRVLLVRAADPAGAVPAIRSAVWSMDPNQPIGRVELVADMYADAFGRERFVLQLMGAFGLIAVALTAAGIFGVLSQVVARRTREIGVRVALGARAADIVRLVASRGLALVAMGTVLGVGGALALSRFLEALLFQVAPADPMSFAIVTMVMVAVALVACWLPTRRAMRVDPAVALRVE